MQTSIINLLVAVAFGSLVQAAPAVNAPRAVVTSCPTGTTNVGAGSSTIDPVWKNVCCAYSVDSDTCCLLDPSQTVAGITFAACDGFSL